jgi:hypothetical protein
LVWYSQDFRPYSFVVAIGLAAMTAAVSLLMKPSLLTGIAFAIGMTAAFYTHYALLALIPLQILLIVFLKTGKEVEARGVRYWLFGLAAAGIAFFPWLKTPAARAFFSVLKTGSYPGQMLSKGLGIGTTTLILIVVAAAYLSLLAGIHLIRYVRGARTPIDKSGDEAPLSINPVNTPGFSPWYRAGSWYAEKGRIEKKAGRGGAAAKAIGWTLWVVFLGLSVMPRGYSIKKQVALIVPYGMLMIGCAWPWERTNRKKIATALALSFVFSLVNVLAVPKDEWKQAVSFLTEEYRTGDVVFLLPGYGSFPFEYYSRGKLPGEGIDASYPEEKIAAVLSSGRRIWLVSNREKYVDPEGRVRGMLDRMGTLNTTKPFYRVRVDLYTKGRASK